MFLDNKYRTWYYALMAKRRNNPLDSSVYTERHHELPKSLGGGGGLNLVRLTAREHLLAHVFLLRMLPKGKARGKMASALRRMLNAPFGKWSSRKYRPRSSILYASLRERCVVIDSNEHPLFGKKRAPMSAETKVKISVSRRKALESGEIQKKISAALVGKKVKGHKLSEEQKRRVSATHKGKKISDEQKAKISAALKGKSSIQPLWSDERKARKSAAMTGTKRAPHSEEAKEKMREAHRRRKSSEQNRELSAVA